MANPIERVVLDDRFIREWLQPENIEKIVYRVKNKLCQCCSSSDAGLMDCGHFECDLCRDQKHQCLACVIST